MNARLTPPAPAFLEGGNDMGARMRAFDWDSHPLGPPDGWPAALRMAVSLCLSSSFPTAIYWGPEFHVLYNDAWSVIRRNGTLRRSAGRRANSGPTSGTWSARNSSR
jgi:hypothetical protein